MTLIALPMRGHANRNDDLAAELRALADAIEHDEHGLVDTVVMVLEAGGQLERRTYGKPIDRARVVGLLTMATHNACCIHTED